MKKAVEVFRGVLKPPTMTDQKGVR
jgi:hypothetical protein